MQEGTRVTRTRGVSSTKGQHRSTAAAQGQVMSIQIEQWPIERLISPRSKRADALGTQVMQIAASSRSLGFVKPTEPTFGVVRLALFKIYCLPVKWRCSPLCQAKQEPWRIRNVSLGSIPNGHADLTLLRKSCLTISGPRRTCFDVRRSLRPK